MALGIIYDDVTDAAGNAIANIDVTIYIAGTVTKASLFDASEGGAPLANPVQTNASGVFSAYVAAGDYDVSVDAPGGTVVRPNVTVADGDDIADLLSVRELGAITSADKVTYDGESATVDVALDARVPTVATLAELPAALLNVAVGKRVDVLGRTSTGDGYQGSFFRSSTDYSAEVAVDTQQGIYIDLGDGTYGVRSYGQAVNSQPRVKPEWFGVTYDGVTDDAPAAQVCHNVGKYIEYSAGKLLFGSTVNITTEGQKVEGAGWSNKDTGGGTDILTATDIETFNITGFHVLIQDFFLDNSAASMSNRHIHFVNDSFGAVNRVRTRAVENFTATGGGITFDNGSGGIGGSVGIVTNCNINHGSIEVRRSDVHIKNCWVWANSRPYAIGAFGSVGNLKVEDCDILPPQTAVAARKAGIYLSGALTIPVLTNVNFDGNTSLATGSGLLAENGVIGLNVQGGNCFGHDEDAIILDSIISPVVQGVSFYNNNVAENGATDVTLRQNFAQAMEKPQIKNCSHVQTAALAGTTGPAIKVVTGTSYSGIRITGNSIHQPGAGGGYDDVEILLEDGYFANIREGSLAENYGTRRRYNASASVAISGAATTATMSHNGPNLAYQPRLDQFDVNFEGTKQTPMRLQSVDAGSTILFFDAVAGAGNVHWSVSL